MHICIFYYKANENDSHQFTYRYVCQKRSGSLDLPLHSGIGNLYAIRFTGIVVRLNQHRGKKKITTSLTNLKYT